MTDPKPFETDNPHLKGLYDVVNTITLRHTPRPCDVEDDNDVSEKLQE